MERAAVALIRKLFDALDRGQVESVTELLAEDAKLYVITEERWLCRSEFESYLVEMHEADRSEVHAQRLEPIGEHVLVVGRLREFHDGELRDRPVSWLVSVGDGVITRIEAFASEHEARAALG